MKALRNVDVVQDIKGRGGNVPVDQPLCSSRVEGLAWLRCVPAGAQCKYRVVIGRKTSF